jgi:hypothetical protein
VPKPRRREVCGETLVNALSQADHDCCGKTASGRRKDAFNRIAESRSE